MNIQINCRENVSEDDLRYIYYNLNKGRGIKNI